MLPIGLFISSRDIEINFWHSEESMMRFNERGEGGIFNSIQGESKRQLTGREATGDGRRADVPRELEDGALAVGPARHDEHVGRVLDGDDGPGGQEHLLPRLLDVDDVDAVGATLEDVLLHRRLGVLGPDVGRGRQHLGDVGLLKRVKVH